MPFPNKKPTTYEVLRSHGVSRRTFLDFCTRTTALMGLAPAMVPSMAKALVTQPRVPVIWLNGLETKLCARWLKAEYEALMANVRRGGGATADSSKWDPATWPGLPAKEFGFTEAPRGACAHWIRVGSDKKIASYQIVVPSTWNASSKNGAGKKGGVRIGAARHSSCGLRQTAGDSAHNSFFRSLSGVCDSRCLERRAHTGRGSGSVADAGSSHSGSRHRQAVRKALRYWATWPGVAPW